MDIFQFCLLIALGLFIIWRGGVIWKRGARGFSITMFVLAAFVFYEAGRVYFSQSEQEPADEQVITSPGAEENGTRTDLDEKPTGLDEKTQRDAPKIDNNKQYMSAPLTDENGDQVNQ